MRELKKKLISDPDFDEETRNKFLKKAEKSLAAEQLLKKDSATLSL
jgi:hypothetical protein